MKNITFKNYNKSQLALPVELEVFIPDNHIVRIVDQIIDSIDISPLFELYKGGGSSAYHPKILLKDLEEVEAELITPEKLKEVAKKIDESLAKEKLPKEKTKILKKCKKDLIQDQIPRLEKYITQDEILGDRNSYSKTDYDATFMRMKEDHMKNGQLKPAYNVQISTEDQFILNYTIHQKPGDTTTLIPHLNIMRERIGLIPPNIITDAGYGSLENYEFLSENKLKNFVKYNNWLKDFRGKSTSKIYVLKDFIYNKENDYYTCINGENLYYQNTTSLKTGTGYIQTIKNYQCSFCGDCWFRDNCTNSKTGRTLSINTLLEKHKRIARENLNSENGSKLRKKRSVDVEPVFGMIKNNRYFKRFMLRGLEKVNIEWGLLSLAHNFIKLLNKQKVKAYS